MNGLGSTISIAALSQSARRGGTAALLGWLLAFSAPSVAARSAGVTQASEATTPLAIHQTAVGLLIYGPEGRAESVELPDRTDLQRIEAAAGGWIAVGTRVVEDGHELFLLRAVGAERQVLAVPGGREAALRGSPRLAVDAGELVGLVWLEGTRQEDLSVWAAAWGKDGWSAPEQVSPSGPGAQLAPEIAVLGDGSWLLVWAAVDGEDDEIMWSRRGAGGWSAPQRIHEDNSSPDITPTITSIRGGALVAWSTLDERHFRLRTARFDGLAWIVSEPFGFDGSLWPRLVRSAGTAVLLYRTTAPGGWAARRYDAAGNATDQGFVRRREEGPSPILDLRDPAGLHLVFPAAEPEGAPTWLWKAWEPVE